MVIVFIGFNLGMHGFNEMRLPLRRIVVTTITLLLGFAIPMLLVFAHGRLDPACSPDGYVGHGAAGLIVLIGFYGFGVVTNSMDGWPWTGAGMKQLFVGVAPMIAGFFLTTIGCVVLVYPSRASWTGPVRVVMTLPTAIGRFYSVITTWLATALVFDLWPHSAVKTRAGRALAALCGNFALGTVVYFVLLALLKKELVPGDANEASMVPGFGGDPLTWVDLLNLILSIYVVYFGATYGFIRKEAA